MEETLLQQEPVYMTYYSLDSSLNYNADRRYCLSINCEIEAGSAENANRIGNVEFYKLLIDVAIENNYDIFDIFDAEQHILEIGEQIYDFRRADFKKTVDTFYGSDFLGRNVLILSRIELLPDFRGRKLSPRILKDIYNNFHHGCGLVVMKCFPLQVRPEVPGSSNERRAAMHYEQFPTGNKSFQKLHSYYKSIGFQNIPGISQEYMFINPALKNDIFDAIFFND